MSSDPPGSDVIKELSLPFDLPRGWTSGFLRLLAGHTAETIQCKYQERWHQLRNHALKQMATFLLTGTPSTIVFWGNLGWWFKWSWPSSSNGFEYNVKHVNGNYPQYLYVSEPLDDNDCLRFIEDSEVRELLSVFNSVRFMPPPYAGHLVDIRDDIQTLSQCVPENRLNKDDPWLNGRVIGFGTNGDCLIYKNELGAAWFQIETGEIVRCDLMGKSLCNIVKDCTLFDIPFDSHH